MKFMVILERKDIIISPFKSAETNKEVDTGSLLFSQSSSYSVVKILSLMK